MRKILNQQTRQRLSQLFFGILAVGVVIAAIVLLYSGEEEPQFGQLGSTTDTTQKTSRLTEDTLLRSVSQPVRRTKEMDITVKIGTVRTQHFRAESAASRTHTEPLNAAMEAYQKAFEQDAVRIGELAKQQAPENPHVLNMLGQAYYRQADYIKAEENLSAAVSFGAEEPDVYYYLGRVYVQIGDEPKAKAAFKQALTLDPNFEKANEILAILLE